MPQESCPCHIFSLHYQRNFSMEFKRDVGFFLENEGRTSGKNSSERCLSPVETLKNFQNLQKSRGLSRTALFSCGLNEAFSSNSRWKQINFVMAVAERRQTSKLWLVKWNLMLNKPIRSKITRNHDLFAHVCRVSRRLHVFSWVSARVVIGHRNNRYLKAHTHTSCSCSFF